MSSTTFSKRTPHAEGPPPAWRGLSGAGWLVALCSALLGGCLVDLDDRCGTHQKYDDTLIRCVCADGYGLYGTKCLACGENEVGSLDGCSCAPGTLRVTPDAPCSVQDTLGKACTKDEECVHPTFNHCHLTDGGGYCTQPNCTTTMECPTSASYACNTREAPSFCERPPTGFGASCAGPDDCASFEASYCEVNSSHACLVNNCAANPSICYGDQVCCDIGLIGQSICIPPDQLSDGACPAGGKLIKDGV
ncbi:MAG: hypothetical protein QM778_28040 [Myxococcales bacterium]